VVALLVHLLLNIWRKGGSLWMFRKLKHMKELVLVIPVSKNMTTLEVVGTLFCVDKHIGTNVLCHYFDKWGVACPAF
jgi:hypothetical protein